MNNLIYYAIAGSVIAFLKYNSSKKRIITINSIENNFRDVLKKLKTDYKATNYECKRLEQLYRLETANFKSKQFLRTLSPGMERFNTKYPFGWVTLNKTVWAKNKQFAPIGSVEFKENATGIKKHFLKFNSLFGSVITVLINARNRNKQGRFLAWYSLNDQAQLHYKKLLNRQKTTISDSI